MPEALKEVYNKAFFERIMDSIEVVIPSLNRELFLTVVFTQDWEKLELKARTSYIAEAMKTFLPTDFKKAAPLLVQLTEQLNKNKVSGGYAHLFIPEFIEKNGLDDEKTALKCIEKVTQFVSCEFAVRPFIRQNPEGLINQLILWSKHTNQHVRRLASEGCRPRLPWASSFIEFKKDPSPILPILENLKADNSLYVKKSVANNLNDISKDHPELFLTIAKEWLGRNDHSNWIIKHAARTLLKDGNSKAMQLFGYAKLEKMDSSGFKVIESNINMGESVSFEFQLKNKSNTMEKVRLEYGIYFKMSNQQNNRKVFKISERQLSAGEVIKINKSHTIKPISTRKYYAGEHFISLILNGHELAKQAFILNL